MSPRKTILKALSARQAPDGAPDSTRTSIRPSEIPGFHEAPERYQQSINALLKDRLIEGFKDPEGRMAIALNSHREEEIQRILRPFWARPAVVGLLALFAVVLVGATLLG